MLAAQVAAGKLPPLARRLPADPLRVRPLESLGEYGGTWHMLVDNPDLSLYKLVGGYAPLVRWNPDASGPMPGLASSWEYNHDGSQLTLHLRHGVRWSDGAPYTSADLMYWADISATKQTAVTREYWTLARGKEMTCSAPDPYTFVMKFGGPNWYVPLHLAGGYWEAEGYQLPKHYLIRFDPRYNHAYKDFSEFDKLNQTQFNPDLPTLCPWHLAAIENAGFRMVLQRNPYYWMTDTSGRQLPYIDTVVCTYEPDPQVQVLRILSGQVDAQFRLPQLRDLGLYLRGQKQGHYRVLRWDSGNGANDAFMLNWTTPDAGLRPLMRDLRFRRALSLAIDRDKCNQVAWSGLATPQQATVSSESWHFRQPGGAATYREWADADAAFDIPQAGKLLDSIGLTKRDADGYRLRPDGKRLALMIDLGPSASEDVSVDESQIVADGWRRLGIDAEVHNWPAATFTLRQNLGQFEVSPMPEAEMDVFTFPDWIFPTTSLRWHAATGKWFSTSGKQGERPTGVVKQLLDIYEQIQSTGDIKQAHQLVLKGCRLMATDGCLSLGTTGGEPVVVIVRDTMRNVPASGRVLGPWEINQPATSFPETFYYASPKSPFPAPQIARAARQKPTAAAEGAA